MPLLHTDHLAAIFAKIKTLPIAATQIANASITEAKLAKTVTDKLAAIPTKTSQLTNDSNFITASDTDTKIAAKIAEIVAGAPEDLDTLKEIADWIKAHPNDVGELNASLQEIIADIEQIKTDYKIKDVDTSNLLTVDDNGKLGVTIYPKGDDGKDYLRNKTGLVNGEVLRYALQDKLTAIHDSGVNTVAGNSCSIKFLTSVDVTRGTPFNLTLPIVNVFSDKVATGGLLSAQDEVLLKNTITNVTDNLVIATDEEVTTILNTL
ncbi:MAG: putative tail fiber [crAssphage sp. isolate ctbg_1]|uniref:Putative tail fiber n=1 Tax=crAssphage sp. isolate ctbg_1 TaxID=2989854 RepID=A0A345MSZ8_9CAUD|nr:MAG: putative tail fiber [crAssphage sp. isolate ctbg_1]AXH74498.1 MAG: putative tail fiber [crAssphage sp. isolate ctbg_1]